MNQAFFKTAALMKAQNTFQFSTTSAQFDSAGFIYGFFQEKRRCCFKILQISKVWILKLRFSAFMSIVSLISLVVMTLFSSFWRASFTAEILLSSKRDFSCAHISYFRNRSSAFSTYCQMRWLIFSGLMQNSFPISQGFLFSWYLICKIAQTFPRKFFDSYVLGFAILRILTSEESLLAITGISGITIGS